MASNPMSEVLRQLRQAALLPDGAGLTDGQLLEDYLGRREEAASSYRRACALAQNEAQRRFLERRLAELGG